MHYESLDKNLIPLEIPNPQGASGNYFEQISHTCVMTGMQIRKGDIINAVMPIFQPLEADRSIRSELYIGTQQGDNGGGGDIFLQVGYVLVGLRFQTVNYYGHGAINALSLIWRRWFNGQVTNEELISEPLIPQLPSYVKTFGSPEWVEVYVPDEYVAIGICGRASSYVNTLSLIAGKPAFDLSAIVRKQDINALVRVNRQEMEQKLIQEQKDADEAAEGDRQRAQLEQQQEQADRDATNCQLSCEFSGGTRSATEGLSVVTFNNDDSEAFDGKLRLLYANRSFIRAIFELQEPATFAVLYLSHLSCGTGGKKGYSPVKIEVNNKCVAANHDPRSDNYTIDRFEITSYLHVGINEITITLGDITTHYWIEWLKLFINLPHQGNFISAPRVLARNNPTQ
ncbi:hypothetical protein [Brasilonema octagenarum]|uniref:Uncharacterized protein n=1 Tax=Brasilonema octagenarum UFV-OR1 TaxID=417115 RepID=A0ABX1M692_9CYAN|nr:hypothetical protein [Brasilonema octagenarum]NMF63355.1 hypothetical protein [Brasilonema octagenarum UFV-OR1]